MNDGGHFEAIDHIIAFKKRKQKTFMLDADELRCSHSRPSTGASTAQRNGLVALKEF